MANKIKSFQFRFKIINGKGDLPEVEVRCGDMVKVRGLLLNEAFEEADTFFLWNFDRE